MKPLIIVLLLLNSTAWAQGNAGECSKLLNNILMHKVTYKKYQNIPFELFGDTPPSREFIDSIDIDYVAHELLGKKSEYEKIFFDAKRALPILEYQVRGGRTFKGLYSFFKKNLVYDGDYYFIGNGMHMIERIASEMFSNSKAESRIKKLDISRSLFADENFNEKIKKYLKSQGIDKGHKGKIVLIDSLGESRGQNHSIFKVAVNIVKTLVDEGVSLDQAVKKIVVLGIPEVGGHSFSAKTIGKFQKSLKNYISGEDDPEYFYTMAEDSGEVRDMLKISIFFPYWNQSKFYTFDKKNNPVQHLRDIENNGLKVLQDSQQKYGGEAEVRKYLYIQLSERLKYIIVMKELYKSMDKHMLKQDPDKKLLDFPAIN